ncbi:MAG: hypothetical protein IJG41_01000 [Bacteroidales bacterium]|nr:hypothetical protein [Bacteroidales bacterium]
MNDNFNEQKDILLSIKHEISLLHQQVDFLLRNEKAVGLLDLDVMMNRTHTIYDKMCSIDLGGSPEAIDEESLINSFVMATEEPMAEEEPAEEEPKPKEEPEPEEEPEPMVVVPEPMVEEPEEVEPEPEEEKPTFIEEESVVEEEPVEEEEPEPEPEEEIRFVEEEEDTLVEENEDAYFEEEVEDVEEEKPIEEKPADIPHNTVDDLGFILNFEPSDEDEAPVEEENPSVYTTGDEIEMTIPQSLADKYQHDSLNDLRSAIGINDKFLLVNELFGGSMEKYNKSIDNLNDLKTLNGALVYMNELRVELQWNSNNEAYKRLLELVHRKFE